MSREIKFRIWNGKEYADKASDGDYEYFIDPTDGDIVSINTSREGGGVESLKPYGYIIEQFTGINDKNGLDIYEGDIVRMLYTDWPSMTDEFKGTLDEYMDSISFVGEVVFNNANWEIKSIDRRYGGFGYSSIYPGTHGRIVVIGNIHEHKHLLL